jgi:16S rRNA (guanine527-N7)-methyltransferase
MHPDRIAELLDPFLGPQDQRPDTQDLLVSISTYIDILQRWNARINLTAIRDEEEIVTRHFGESLFAARHLFPNRVVTGASPVPPGRSPAACQAESRTQNSSLHCTNDCPSVADVGSGPGFPGIPIKLWAPGVSLTLIESNQKKATFLKEVTRALTLTDVNVQTSRAESLTGASFDLITLRAVERFESILPVAARLIAPGGGMALLIGQIQLASAQAALPNLDWSHPIPVPTSKSRVLVTARKP